MLTHPPFCPNRECPHHHPEEHHSPPHLPWYHKDGTYPSKLHSQTQRFVCTRCGTKFSVQTFSLDYGVKKHLPYQEIFHHLTSSGSGIRSLARLFGVTDKVIRNRIGRLARQAIALHASLRDHFSLQEDLVADGFESFTFSQYFPNNIHLLAGKDSQYLYGIDYAHISRKGRMTDAQKKRKEFLYSLFTPPPGDISRSFSRTLSQFLLYFSQRKLPSLRLFTDMKPDYHRVLHDSSLFHSLHRKGAFAHIRIPSTRLRDLRNDLFSVNYFDREVRKDQSNHVRETVMFSREVNNCMERFWLYAAYHNYRKPYRVAGKGKSELSHGEVAGIPRQEIEKRWKTFFTQRCFFSHLRLSPSELFAWFRCYASPFKLSGPWTLRYVTA